MQICNISCPRFDTNRDVSNKLFCVHFPGIALIDWYGFWTFFAVKLDCVFGDDLDEDQVVIISQV